jgi:hypothetical protein
LAVELVAVQVEPFRYSGLVHEATLVVVIVVLRSYQVSPPLDSRLDRKYAVLAGSVIWLVRLTYAYAPAVCPDVATVTEPPETSTPLLARVSFTVWEPVFPETTQRPSASTTTGDEPVVNARPT